MIEKYGKFTAPGRDRVPLHRLSCKSQEEVAAKAEVHDRGIFAGAGKAKGPTVDDPRVIGAGRTTRNIAERANRATPARRRRLQRPRRQESSCPPIDCACPAANAGRGIGEENIHGDALGSRLAPSTPGKGLATKSI